MIGVKDLENALDVIKKVCDQHVNDCKDCPFEDGNNTGKCQFNRLIPRGVVMNKKTFKPYWEEFDIDERGTFFIQAEGTDCVACVYDWWNWNGFLSDNKDKYRNFGGWLYEGNDGPVWATVPHIAYEGYLYIYLSLDGNQHKITAPIPTKIRFMRYKK